VDRARGELFHELVVGALDLGVGLDERLKPFFAFESFGTGVSPALSALTLLPRLPWPVWSGRCPGAILLGAHLGQPGHEAKFAPLHAGILGRVPVFWHFA
jgi:hypothetical protein